MAIYHYCFDLYFLIAVIIFFVVVLVLCANVISSLFLTASKKALTFIITGRKAFSRSRGQDYKGLFED